MLSSSNDVIHLNMARIRYKSSMTLKLLETTKWSAISQKFSNRSSGGAYNIDPWKVMIEKTNTWEYWILLMLQEKKVYFLISLIRERCWLTPSAASSVEVKSTPFRSSFLEVLGGMTGISPSDPNVPAAWSRTSSAYNVQRTEGDINRTTTGADSRVGRAYNFFYAFVSFFGVEWGALVCAAFLHITVHTYTLVLIEP